MPLYALKCLPCNHSFEEAAPSAERYAIKCPKCGSAPCETDFAAQRSTSERRFAGSECESVFHGFHPKEVQRARQLAPNHQHCIRDDGSVHFSTRSEQRSFSKRMAEVLPQDS